MNRLANALTGVASALPSSASDASSNPALSSPQDLSVPTFPGRHDGGPSPSHSQGHAPSHGHGQGHGQGHNHIAPDRSLYADPRQTHFHTPPDRFQLPARLERDRERSTSRRPAYLRHVSDNALVMVGAGRSGSGTSTPRAVSASRERGVLADLGVGKRGKRVSGMVKGPEGRYAVGGPQCLKVVHISPPSSGTSSPTSNSPNRGSKGAPSQLLARGSGGVKLTEVANLWKSSWTVSKGVNDLDWGSGTYSNKIVTATPGGTFLIFDITKSKFEREVHGGSARPLNRVLLSPHAAYGHVLLTGSAEGQAKLWDLRESNPHQKKYYKHSSAVTALSFSPEEPQAVLVGTENGTIKRYDIRMAPRPVGSLWGAHGNRPVMDMRWKASAQGEQSGGWMASAGADRTVQIWDMSQSWERNPPANHSLHTSSPIRRVAWRPDHPTELAIVPLAPTVPETDDDIDTVVEVWDVRRHHVAKYALPTGGSTVDAVWGDDDMGIVAAFSTGYLAQVDMRNRTLPLDALPRQTAAWNHRGELAFAADRFKHGEIPFDDLRPEYANNLAMVGKRPKAIGDAPFRPVQAVGVVTLPETDEDDFIHLATQYRLEGDTPAKLCEWNRVVAELVDRVDDARLWSFLGRLISELSPSEAKFDEEIWSHPLPTTERVPTPPGGSPRGGMSRSGTPDRLETSPVYTRPKGILLDRVASLSKKEDHIEELLDSTPTSPSSAGFVSFRPVASDDRRLSDSRWSVSTAVPRTRESTATIVPPNSRQQSNTGALLMQRRADGAAGTGSATHSQNASASASQVQSLATSPVRPAASALPSAQASREGSALVVPTTSTLGTSHSDRASASADRAERRGRDRTTALDYPDPYGIAPSTGSRTETSVSSQMTTRDPSPARSSRSAHSQALVHGHGQGQSQSQSHERSVSSALALGGAMRMTASAGPSASASGRESREGSGDKGSAHAQQSGAGTVAVAVAGATAGLGTSMGRARSGSVVPSSVGGAGTSSVPLPRGASQRSSADEGGTRSAPAPKFDRGSDGTSVSVPPPSGQGSGSGRRKMLGVGKRKSGDGGKKEWMSEKEWTVYKEERCRVFKRWWEGVVEEGNVQLALTAMVVASDIMSFAPRKSERVARAYLDILERHRLSIPAAYVRKHAQLLALQIYASRPGVTHVAHCQRCGKSTGSLDEIDAEKGPRGKRFWFCKKCRLDARVCAVCRRGVRGLWMGCNTCKHGGHQKCLRLYYMEADMHTIPLRPPIHPVHGHGHGHASGPGPGAAPSTPGPGNPSSAFQRTSSSATATTVQAPTSPYSSTIPAFAHGSGTGTGSGVQAGLGGGGGGGGGSSGYAAVGTSHESSDIVRRSSSGEMYREGSGDGHDHDAAGVGTGAGGDGAGHAGYDGAPMEVWTPFKGWNTCAQGCGCRCRVVFGEMPVGGE